jgi:carboxylesterase type B
MDLLTEEYSFDLQFRGFITGLTVKEKSSGNNLCHYFGGLPYALPPVGPFRWHRPRPLPPCYRYGTRANQGHFTGYCGVCPQPVKSSPNFDEDCLQLAVWVPAGTPPPAGWPVYFYIHGGFLQYGTANPSSSLEEWCSPIGFISQTDCKCIVVKPSYRLNVFGFLSSQELLDEPSNCERTVGNLGFWDQRLALEWTYKNINYFGGNPSNITVGGYSAGSHSAFYQLQYDLKQPEGKHIIKRVNMHSNGPGIQPKSLKESQLQFDELIRVLGISAHLSPAVKLQKLRETKSAILIEAIAKMHIHEFRAVTDGVFISPTLFSEIRNGSFGRQLKDRGIQILVGENSDEHFVYATHRTPSNSLESLVMRLNADYPAAAVKALIQHYFPNGRLPPGWKSWQYAFGRVYADVQIHATERGFIEGLINGGAGHLVKRYRIEWRAKCVDKLYPTQWGATHSADGVLWWYGDGDMRLMERESNIAKTFALDHLAQWFRGEEMVGWEAQGPLQVRRLRRDGEIDVWRDDKWREGLETWDFVLGAMEKGGESMSKL